MKTKTKPQWKVLIAFAAILCCVISASAQTPIIPTFDDFHGTWIGPTPTGENVSVTLAANGACNFNVNGSPLNAGNTIVGYRLPQYSPKAIADNGAPSASEIVIKFFTQNAIAGVRTAASSPASNSSTVTDNSVEQIYTGYAVISRDASGHDEMTLYLDVLHFSSAPPSSSDGSAPYCTLIKQ